MSEVKMDVYDCTMKLRMLSNNLTLVRLGFGNKDFIPNQDIADNAICVIEDEIIRLADVIDDLLCKEGKK